MGSRSQVVPPPPPGFVLQTILPPPPPGFVLEGQPKPTARPAWRPLGPVGRAYALAPTPEEAPALQEAGRAFGEALTEPISAQLGGESFSSLVERTLGEWGRLGRGRIGLWKAEAVDAARIAAGVADFIQSPAGVAALAATVATGGAAAPYIGAGFGAHFAAQTPQAIRTYLENPTPENLQQALLTPGFAALMGSAAGHVPARAAPEGVSRVRPAVERAPEAKPAPPTKPLPAPQPVSPREAADLGVAAERVPEVLRRQREAEAVTARAGEREPPRPSPIVKEPPPPPEGFVLERPSELQRLEAAGVFKRRTGVDEFGDVIEKGGRIVDSMGRSGRVLSVSEKIVRVDFGKGPEPVPIGEVTVKRHARPKALEGIGRKPVRDFGESEEAFGARVNRQAGYDRLFSNPLIPLSEAYTRLVGRPVWEWGERLLWRMTPDFIQRAIRTRPELIKERVPSGEAYVEARREARGFIVEKAERGFELGERLTQKFSVEEQQALGRMVKGEARGEDLVKLRQDAAWNDAIEAAKDARTEFDNLGGQAVMQGLLRDETFFRNYGKYMPRLYRKYELPYEQLAKQFRERKPTRLELSRFKRRKDIPEHIRMMMGEILEPGLPVAKGIAQIGHDVANMRLFNIVADNPLWAARSLDNLWRQGAKPADFVQMPTTTKLGRLSGSWVNKYIADDLNQIIRARTELQKMSRALVGEWKFSKVILNPATHGRNMMSNTILAHAGGLPLTRVDIYYRALRELVSRGEIYREAKTASQGRMGRGTYAAAEFEMLLDSWNKTTGGLGDRFAGMSEAFRAGKPSEAFKQVRISQTELGKRAARTYQAEEEWFKLAKYIHNKEKGMAPKEAWLDAERWLFDYSEVPSFIDWSRQSPLGAPFITFTYKALPVIAESIVTAPWRMGAILGTLYWINKKAADVLGLAEKQQEEIEKVLPARMRGKVFGVPKFIMLPFRDKYGQVQYLDLTYILPWGDIGEAGGLGRGIVEKIPVVRGVAGLVRQAPGLGSPLVQTLAEIGLNKSSYTDREIYQPWESKAEIAKKINLYLLRQIAPSLVPGGYGFTRLQKAITQQPDYMGRTTSLPSAAASALLGLKITPIDPRLQRIYRRAERERDVRGIEMQIGRVRRNRGLKASEKAEEIRRLRQMQIEIRRGKSD